MPKKKLSRLSRFFLSAVCLAGAYLLCRFGLFSLHGMKQWPAVLAAAGHGPVRRTVQNAGPADVLGVAVT